NLVAGDGCESTKATDVANCGSCGDACPALPNALPACSGGICGLGPCLPNFGNCDGVQGNGCEINLLTSAANCAGCNNPGSLPGRIAACVAGSCTIGSCAGGHANCDGQTGNGCEINTDVDPLNCGGCDNVCSLPQASADCVAGLCEVQACAPPFA